MTTATAPPPMRAHPRSRGENVCTQAYKRNHAGSSPLTRGKLRTMVSPASASGLIPAHAGKTSGRRQTIRRRRAHPRSRGENCERCVQPPQGSGSSPLTRGKPRVWTEVLICLGLIPAHAGKTSGSKGGAGGHGAHPRSRGENGNIVTKPITGRGSSPLTRGKRQSPSQTLPYLGLIPAHAGKTNAAAASR